VTFQIRVPAPSSELLGNLLGLAGILAVVVGVGGLLGNWWVSVVLAGAAMVFLSWVASTHQEQAASTGPRRVSLDDLMTAKRALASVETALKAG
jgi:hypothetical protein